MNPCLTDWGKPFHTKPALKWTELMPQYVDFASGSFTDSSSNIMLYF